MCGIFGIADFGAQEGGGDLPVVLEAMGRALHHRGPDDAGTWHARDGKATVGLGTRRLSIIDLVGGRQPILNEDGTVALVCNGEIYNYRELREGLQAKGHRFRTASDSEVLVHLYEEYGWEAVSRLRGMFAFALWDSRDRRLILGRDRLGIKPLLFHHDRQRPEAHRIVFASELRAVLAGLHRPPDVSTESLLRLLVLKYVPGPETALQGVHKLMPGTVLVMSESGVAVHRYWTLPAVRKEPPTFEEGLEKTIARSLRDAVRSHLMSDVPVGAFLSGGIDSTAVVALMSSVSRPERMPFHTFSIGFEGSQDFSELEDARQTAGRYGTMHHEMVLRPDDVSSALSRLVGHLEEPLSDPAIVPTYLLSKLASRYVKVVLTGEGADELFGGYRRYALDRLAQVYTWLPPSLRTQVLTWLSHAPMNRRVVQGLRALSDANPIRRHLSWVGTFTAEELREVVAQPVAASQVLDGLVETWQPYFSGAEQSGRHAHDARDGMLRVDLATWLPDDLLVKVDRMSMAVSLEARVPYLDHPLVELVAGLPANLKIRGGVGKAVFRAAVADLVPAEILNRRKRGLDLPLGSWLRGPLRAYLTDMVALEGPPGLFNEHTIRRYLNEHLSGVQDRGRQLWTVLIVKLWYHTIVGESAVLRHERVGVS
jgi:asparagine synthase (glutamine-hydrolysing)